MSDGAKTTVRKMDVRGQRRHAWLALVCVLACAPVPGMADPAKQELAGSARPEEPRPGPQAAAPASAGPSGGMEPAILFATGSAQLTPRATRILDRFGRSLTAPDASANRYRVEGHGDGGGSPASARDLARRRAEAVANYLEQNCAVVASRLDVVASAVRPIHQVRVIGLQP